MVIIYLLGAVALVSILYLLLFAKFSFKEIATPSKILATNKPVSVIICAKNEAQNLKNNIPKILSQEYPFFELVLINDASSDNTLDVMEELQAQDHRITIVNVANNEAFWGSKKYALTLGIKRAKHPYLLFTDADCVPVSNHWISLMAQHFSQKKHLVLGYGGYQKQKGLLNMLIRFETLMTATQYFSYAVAKIPYMGVGRNISYTTQLFFDNKGFINHINFASGDDDLFVNETATKNNTSICVIPEAFTISTPKNTWTSWIRQKRRHVTTAAHYKFKHKILLGAYAASNMMFWVLSIVALCFTYWQIAAIIIVLRFLLQYIIIGKSAYKLNEQQLVPYFIILEPLLIVIQIVIFILNMTSRPSSWK